MDVIEKLVAGHRNISEKKDILKKLVKSFDNDAFFWDKSEEITAFFKKEIVEHIALEEKVLFPVLKKVLDGKELEILNEIEAEHTPIKLKLDGFKIVSENHARYASKATREHMLESAFEVVEIISAHADKEDEELFPVVEKRFSSGNLRELEDLYFKFLQI